ncbi:MAG: DNA-binding protein [Gammaproteobacteria bacterium]|nr:MAG: DNA-binding protein [Gammaproteobacteria bacterium]
MEFDSVKALFVAWQNPKNRSWAPVGRLTYDDGLFRFVYTRGAKDMGDSFQPFGAMKDLNSSYISEKLFPLFANRVLSKSRPEYEQYLKWLGMSENAYDVMDELSRTGGFRATDSLELFPCPEPTAQNQYVVYFFSRGIRHILPENRERVNKLEKGQSLFLMCDIQNKYDPHALVLRTDDPVTLVGYAPRYYSGEFSSIVNEVSPENIEVTAERVNKDAPLQYRLLCKMSSPWPTSFQPCVHDQFEVLA